jgi:hypothetical protein
MPVAGSGQQRGDLPVLLLLMCAYDDLNGAALPSHGITLAQEQVPNASA